MKRLIALVVVCAAARVAAVVSNAATFDVYSPGGMSFVEALRAAETANQAGNYSFIRVYPPGVTTIFNYTADPLYFSPSTCAETPTSWDVLTASDLSYDTLQVQGWGVQITAGCVGSAGERPRIIRSHELVPTGAPLILRRNCTALHFVVSGDGINSGVSVNDWTISLYYLELENVACTNELSAIPAAQPGRFVPVVAVSLYPDADAALYVRNTVLNGSLSLAVERMGSIPMCSTNATCTTDPIAIDVAPGRLNGLYIANVDNYALAQTLNTSNHWAATVQGVLCDDNVLAELISSNRIGATSTVLYSVLFMCSWPMPQGFMDPVVAGAFSNVSSVIGNTAQVVGTGGEAVLPGETSTLPPEAEGVTIVVLFTVTCAAFFVTLIMVCVGARYHMRHSRMKMIERHMQETIKFLLNDTARNMPPFETRISAVRTAVTAAVREIETADKAAAADLDRRMNDFLDVTHYGRAILISELCKLYKKHAAADIRGDVAAVQRRLQRISGLAPERLKPTP